MHRFVGLDAHGTDGSDPSKVLATWEVDGKLYHAPSTLTRLEQLYVAYEKAGYDTADYRIQRMIEYREMTLDEVLEAIFEQFEVAGIDPSPAYAIIDQKRKAIKSKHPKK